VAKKEIIEAAKTYWLRYFPLEEMPDIASIIAESYRNHLITDNQAMTALDIAKKSIENWIKDNNKIHKDCSKKSSTKTRN
jgi:hypothetical protein